MDDAAGRGGRFLERSERPANRQAASSSPGQIVWHNLQFVRMPAGQAGHPAPGRTPASARRSNSALRCRSYSWFKHGDITVCVTTPCLRVWLRHGAVSEPRPSGSRCALTYDALFSLNSEIEILKESMPFETSRLYCGNSTPTKLDFHNAGR